MMKVRFIDLRMFGGTPNNTINEAINAPQGSYVEHIGSSEGTHLFQTVKGIFIVPHIIRNCTITCMLIIEE